MAEKERERIEIAIIVRLNLIFDVFENIRAVRIRQGRDMPVKNSGTNRAIQNYDELSIGQT